jgi:hypothetical protein
MKTKTCDASDQVITENPRVRQRWSELRAQFLSRYPLVQVRLYSEKDAALIERIQHLMDCGFSLAEACERFLATLPDERKQEQLSLGDVVERWYNGFPEQELQRLKLCADCIWKPRRQ